MLQQENLQEFLQAIQRRPGPMLLLNHLLSHRPMPWLAKARAKFEDQVR